MTSSFHEQLSAAIEQLYATFARYPLAAEVIGCPCCVKAQDQALIRSRPLRSLMPDDLEKYAFKALTTWGSENDLRHFLPRIFELASWSDSTLCDVQVLFAKLPYADWRRWPKPEQVAIEQYFAALWAFTIHNPAEDAERQTDSYLCAIGRAVEDLQPYLDAWISSDDPVTRWHLFSFIQENQPAIFQGRLDNPYWSVHQPQVLQIIHWLLSPALEQHLEAAFMAETDPDQAKILGDSLDLLYTLHMFPIFSEN